MSIDSQYSPGAGIGEPEFGLLVTLVEDALTLDELETFDNLPQKTIEAMLVRLQSALGKRTSITRDMVRRICGYQP